MIYTVTLNPCVDCIMTFDALEPGALNRAKTQELRFGGKGINVSRVLAELGTPSVALGFVGGFTGDAIAASLKGTLVTPDFVALRGGFSRVNVKVAAPEGETELNAPGPQVEADELDTLFAKLDALGEGDTLVLSGSAPSSLPDGVFAQLAAKASERGARFAADIPGAALAACLLYKPFLVKPNRRELEELFGAGADTEASARKLREAGARNVLVSLGADGAMLIDENGTRRDAPALRREVVNTVGAGDSMVAGFLAGYARGGEYALRLASACAAAAVSCTGLAVRETIEEIMNTEN